MYKAYSPCLSTKPCTYAKNIEDIVKRGGGKFHICVDRIFKEKGSLSAGIELFIND